MPQENGSDPNSQPLPTAEPPVTTIIRPPGYALWIIGVTPVLAQLVGSTFNIWYNVIYTEPLLSVRQHAVFLKTIQIYNVTVYPVLGVFWVWMIWRIGRSFRISGQTLTASQLTAARRRVINLPWSFTLLGVVGWLLCIPVFLSVLNAAPGELDSLVWFHLPISILIGMLIALTHAVFALEILSQRLLYPALFGGDSAADVPGAFPLTIRGRGALWAVSAGVCPISSLVLLFLSPTPNWLSEIDFAIAVGCVGILFGLISAWMLARLIAEPVEELRRAARAVAAGDFDTRVELSRADEFGPLISEFNHMVGELTEKRRLSETFGRHVGRRAAEQILRRDPTLGGVEQTVTVLFADIRNFTARCADAPPQKVIGFLNLFLTEMVEIVEDRCGGMVNKFLGDGFMALFGAGTEETRHADAAVEAGRRMLAGLEEINRRLAEQGEPPLAIGIGIHTGPAVVGSIGSPERLEYTAIGDTVNIASRVESLTKVVGKPLLITDATLAALTTEEKAVPLPPQSVKGQSQPLSLFACNP